MSKSDIRKFINSNLNNLGQDLKKNKSKQISSRILDSSFFKKSDSIAFYWPYRDEVDIKLVLEFAIKKNKCCYLPVVNHNCLEFLKYTCEADMQKNKYGILEPCNSEKISPKELDLILVPLVAFDKKCYRLGRGAGYYDKTFMEENDIVKNRLIGVAYDVQEIDKVPVDEWDVRLFGIMTESRFLQV